MIEGVGIDLVHLERVRRFYNNHKDSLSRFLTPQELRAVAQSKKKSLLALFFALKEAVFKALDYHWMNWKEIEIIREGSRSWRVNLSGAIRKWARDRRIGQIIVDGSISSKHALACAMALKGKS